MSRRRYVTHRMVSATHNAQKLFGIDSCRELCSPGLRMLKVALRVKNIQMEPMWLFSHLQTTSDSLLLVLMKMLCLRLKTLPCQKTWSNVLWQSTMYSLTRITSSAWMSHTTWARSTTQMRSTLERSECPPLQTTHSGFTVTKCRMSLTTNHRDGD